MLAGILLVTFLTYLPSLENEFTNWDDREQVLNNTDVMSLSWEGTISIFSSFYVGMYQPVTMQVYAAIYSVFGAEATAYHSFALLLHLLNIILVFVLIRTFCRNDLASLITAALFALSPLQTESVCWVSAMSNLLYTSFYLSGLITYISYLRTKKRKKLMLTFMFFLLSLLSKPTAVTFPVMIILADLYFFRRDWRKLIVEKIPFLILSVVIGMAIITARGEAGHIIAMGERFGFEERLLLPFYAIAFYISTLFFPVDLSAFHPYPVNGLNAGYFLAPLVVFMIMFLIFRLRGETKRQVRAGILFFLISIAIVLDLIPVGVQVVKERYVYMPSIGFYFAFSVLMMFLFSAKLKWLRPAITIAMMAIYISVTVPRSLVWKDSFSLWNDVLISYPEASAPLINRGNAWQEDGNTMRAIEDYSRAILSEPAAADAYLNRALAYSKLGNHEMALNDLDKALSLGINDVDAYNNRGLIRTSAGRYEGAVADFKKALELDPDQSSIWINLGLVEASLQDFNAAIESLSKAIDLAPTSAKAYYWRGRAQLQLKMFEAACDDMKKAGTLGWPAEQIPEFCQ